MRDNRTAERLKSLNSQKASFVVVVVAAAAVCLWC